MLLDAVGRQLLYGSLRCVASIEVAVDEFDLGGMHHLIEVLEVGKQVTTRTAVSSRTSLRPADPHPARPWRLDSRPGRGVQVELLRKQ
jgi:hypothetical protein